jgi:hypothetical protein
LAYAMMNSFIYIFWWDKPRDVRSPIRVYEKVTTNHKPKIVWDGGIWGIAERIHFYLLGKQDRFVQLSKERKVPIFWSSRYGNDKENSGVVLGPSILGMAFGAIHFIAWWHGFPSRAEFILWRMSCIALVAVPLSFMIGFSFSATQPDIKLLDLIGSVVLVIFMLFACLYVVARVATMVIAFTALRSLPSDSLLAVDWTTFIPHI